MNLSIFNWSITHTKKSFDMAQCKFIVQVVWVSSELGWRGLQRTLIFRSLNKGQQPSTRSPGNHSPPGHEKSPQLNKRATERAPGVSRSCRKHEYLTRLPFSTSCHQTRCPPALVSPHFSGAFPGLWNTKEPTARRRAKLGASRNPPSPGGGDRR